MSAKTVLSYAVLAYSLPPGHVFQSRIEGLEGFSDLTTSSENISAAVRAVGEPRRRVAEEGDRGRARREGEDEGAAGEGDDASPS